MSSLSVYQVLRLFEIDAKRVDIQPTKKKQKVDEKQTKSAVGKGERPSTTTTPGVGVGKSPIEGNVIFSSRRRR